MSKSSGVKKVKLGSQGLEVSQQGLGCMGQSSFFYGSPKPEKEIIELLRHAIDLGVTFLDTADMYGEGPQSNEIIIGKAIKGIRDKVQIATKFGCYVHENGDRSLKGDPEYVRFCCESSLKRLDIDCIDLYYQFRVDETVPIEITVGELKKLVEEGKVKYIGLSEASSADIRRAHAIHPITAVQIEWSLWSRDIEEDVVPTCRELGIGIVAHSPLGRGFFAGKNMSELGHDDFRKTHIPRLMAPNLEKNQKFFDRLAGIGKKLEKSPGQVALAWVQRRGSDVVPIPGTTKVQHLEENAGALDLTLSKEELKEIEDAVPIDEVAGDRYIDLYMTFTWRHLNSAPLSSWKPNTPPLASPKPNAPPLASWKPKA